MAIVWWIRHEESLAQAEPDKFIAQYPHTVRLSPNGLACAEELKETLKEEMEKAGKSPDLIVVSPFVRTLQTAIPTINHFFPNEKYMEYEYGGFCITPHTHQLKGSATPKR